MIQMRDYLGGNDLESKKHLIQIDTCIMACFFTMNFLSAIDMGQLFHTTKNQHIARRSSENKDE